jgi:transposase
MGGKGSRKMHKERSESFFNSAVSPDTNTSENNPSISQNPIIDPQVKAVKPRRVRRKFNVNDKLKIIEALDNCANAFERGALLRKEGLYYSSITKWKKELSGKNSNHVNSKSYKLTLAHNQLLRENEKLKKKLSQAEAIIDLQKKVSELLSSHVLDQEMSETQS